MYTPTPLYIRGDDPACSDAPDTISCAPTYSPGPAVPSPAPTSDIATPPNTSLADKIMGPGRRNLIGMIVLLILFLLGCVLWATFAKWPRSKWQAWRARRRERARQRAAVPVVVVNYNKRGKGGGKPCASVLVLESESKYPTLPHTGSPYTHSLELKLGSPASLSCGSCDDGSSIVSDDMREREKGLPPLPGVPPLRVKFSDPIISVCSPPMR